MVYVLCFSHVEGLLRKWFNKETKFLQVSETEKEQISILEIGSLWFMFFTEHTFASNDEVHDLPFAAGLLRALLG